MTRAPAAFALSLGVLAACPSPRGPGAAQVADSTVEIGGPGATLSGVAGDRALLYAALTRAPRTTIEAHKPGVAAPAWRTELAGSGGPLARTGDLLIGVLGGTGNVADLALRGEPGSVIVALDAATGAVRWKLALDATDWVVISAIAATPDGVVIGGSFAGTLRAGKQIVSSGGKTDGFVARILAAPATGGAAGNVAWLVRVGGPSADAVQGVAIAGDRIAVAGTFAPGADLLGLPLAASEERSPAADGFVAELSGAGAARWVQTFGGKEDETVAGVAIDARGRIAVAATVRDTVHVAGLELTASGPSDGLVAWWGPGGAAGTAVLVGGADFDGLRAITAAGDHVVVAGFYSGAIQLGARPLTARGGDDAFLAELDGTAGAIVAAWPVSGDGREEITALAAVPGGFVAGIAHTAAASVDTAALPAPADPMTGAGLVVRPFR